MRSTSLHVVKHIPQRTCVACRQVKDKRELVRLVRISDKTVEVDINGKKAGRGAYLCRTQECWEAGIKDDRLAHSLRTTLTQDNREQLLKFGRDFLQGVS
ncbi:RNase P modulator RnpM [Chloroflexota bacterium]